MTEDMMEKKEEIKQKWQIDNYIISLMPDDSYIINTASGQVLGVYTTLDPNKLALSMYTADLEDPVNKFLLRSLCMNLLWAHQATIIDPEFIDKCSDAYLELYARIKDKADEEGKKAGVIEPEADKSDEEILDELQRQAEIDDMAEDMLK